MSSETSVRIHVLMVLGQKMKCVFLDKNELWINKYIVPKYKNTRVISELLYIVGFCSGSKQVVQYTEHHVSMHVAV